MTAPNQLAVLQVAPQDDRTVHAGELTVSSRVGEGTRVQARLPLEPVPDPGRAPGASA